ncbi:DUF202 domain-containing protein [Roseobacter sp. HKCCA0434]|uniref:YidH family protein n=1 Tax=Roseobacter sp. HKCCA0434 TaxID=3079297 RepID=UPI002905B75B|nr:DUF202 domain-containing protein [Roseobacter sp. HKCCA0434]
MSDKNQMAEDRTDWAEDRTVMANERTFAGWMRTGTAALAIAVGLSAVFKETEPTWLAKSVSMIFVAVALVIFAMARRAGCKVQARLDSHRAEPPSTTGITLIASIFGLGGIATGAILWLL